MALGHKNPEDFMFVSSMGRSVLTNSKKLLSFGESHVFGVKADRRGFEADAERYKALVNEAVADGKFGPLLRRKPVDIFIGERDHFERYAGGDHHSPASSYFGYYEKTARSIAVRDFEKAERAERDRRSAEVDKNQHLYIHPPVLPKDAKFPNATYSMSVLGARSAQEEVKTTLVHELSHHLHHTIEEDPKDFAYGYTIFAQARETVTAYAKTNYSEWFAETHTAYVYNNSALKEFHPEAHDYIQEMRKKHGLET
jgi:hypothetical protein